MSAQKNNVTKNAGERADRNDAGEGMSEQSTGDHVSPVFPRNYRFSQLDEVLIIDACAPLINPA
jgi:hypothetical protein